MLIQSTKSLHQNRLKILVYGDSGVGKTTLAKTIKEPTLIISAEAGLLSLAGRDIDVVDISVDKDGKTVTPLERIVGLFEVHKYLQTDEAKNKYKWVFVDSLTEINQILNDALDTKYPDARNSMQKYGEFYKRMRDLIKKFRDLPDYNVVMTALSGHDKDDTLKRYVIIPMTGKIATELPQYFDEVFYLSMFEKDDKTVRALFTSGGATYIAKDRSGKLGSIEPANLDHIQQKINKEEE